MVKFKDFSRLLSVFHVLFKANLIFKYFSSLCEPLLDRNPEDHGLASQGLLSDDKW